MRGRIEEAFARTGSPLTTSGYGTVFTPWLGEHAPRSYAEAGAMVDPAFTLALHHALRRHGVISMPAPFGRHYLSTAHDEDARDQLAAAFRAAASDLAEPRPVSRP